MAGVGKQYEHMKHPPTSGTDNTLTPLAGSTSTIYQNCARAGGGDKKPLFLLGFEGRSIRAGRALLSSEVVEQNKKHHPDITLSTAKSCRLNWQSPSCTSVRSKLPSDMWEPHTIFEPEKCEWNCSLWRTEKNISASDSWRQCFISKANIES